MSNQVKWIIRVRTHLETKLNSRVLSCVSFACRSDSCFCTSFWRSRIESSRDWWGNLKRINLVDTWTSQLIRQLFLTWSNSLCRLFSESWCCPPSGVPSRATSGCFHLWLRNSKGIRLHLFCLSLINYRYLFRYATPPTRDVINSSTILLITAHRRLGDILSNNRPLAVVDDYRQNRRLVKIPPQFLLSAQTSREWVRCAIVNFRVHLVQNKRTAAKMPDQNTKFVNSLYLKNLVENYYQENDVKIKAYTVEPASPSDIGRSSMNRVLMKYGWSVNFHSRLVFMWSAPIHWNDRLKSTLSNSPRLRFLQLIRYTSRETPCGSLSLVMKLKPLQGELSRFCQNSDAFLKEQLVYNTIVKEIRAELKPIAGKLDFVPE